MKKQLLSFIFCFVLIFSITAQDCPPLDSGISVDYFSFNIGDQNPDDYPNPLVIQGTDEFGEVCSISYVKVGVFNSGTIHVQYANPSPQPWTGTQIDINNFLVDFGLESGECIYVNMVLDIENINIFDSIDVYPNPVKKGQIIYISNGKLENISIKMYDLTGKMVVGVRNSEQNIVELNTSKLNSGIYLLKIELGSTVMSKKIIISN
ncbi:T9SS type A sorting domain-containing protein [Urechidicola croceus]|uniref:Secretion system C-terminal sorting domain-containing protein n=1 Tax=Urechidicola croceus TaxID=1850246 RepID=A0A1D8P8G2_9FLAO|nr:T9SS type A sorting domain-containing protein [Urechidicola croceus]AOW20863.1 hypothetical protein LPB138_09340 [Urechidicola croceus]